MDKKNFKFFVKLVGHVLTGAVLCAVMGLVSFGLSELGHFMANHGVDGLELWLVHFSELVASVADAVTFVGWTVKATWEFLKELFK